MLHVSLPDISIRPLPFYLAMEEYLLLSGKADSNDLFFMWQVNPTVIFGRCQIGSKEVDLDYCRNNNIEVYRRKSGGGCVYADMDNIMFSYITTHRSNVADTFAGYTSKVASMLQALGVNAVSTERNDVMIDGRKVSGNAFYHLNNGSIVHGTMLFDTNMTNMLNAITPSRAKLDAKGVQSVNNHITTLSRHIPLSISQFKEFAAKRMCTGTLQLTPHDVTEIEKLAKPYFENTWRFGLDIKTKSLFNKRLEGVGEFFINVETDPNNSITSVQLAGDFFIIADLDSTIIKPLIGCQYTPAHIAEALRNIDVSQTVRGLSTQQYINLLTYKS